MTPTPEVIEARIRTVEEHIQSENDHNLDAIMATFGPDAQYEDESWGETHEGRAGVQAYYEELVNAVPDLRIDVKKRHVAQQEIILEVEISGTHQGAWRGAPGTGRFLRFPLCAVYTFDERNKLKGERIFYDRVTVLHQMGLFHNPGGLMQRLTTMVCHPLTIAKASVRAVFGR